MSSCAINDVNALVSLKGVSKVYKMDYGTLLALQDIDLTISKGDSLAIMGPSGSGKSTLLHLLGCLDTPTSGHYYFNQRDVSTLCDRELSFFRSSQIGFVFQSFNLISGLNVFENVEVPFLYCSSSFSDKEIEKRIFLSLDKVQMTHRMYHLPSQLSGGEMQRVAIARAIAMQPLLVLADEPTGNLDQKTGESILQLFQELQKHGTTLVIVTHDEEVASYCQRKIQLCDGKII